MDKVQHKTVPVNGLQMHVAELGEGPLVLFIHGFPELWYSWRHQMTFMAARGYRAEVPDMRGYGDTIGAPLEDLSKFTVLHLVGDLIAPNEGKVFVVGHDWGANLAWHLCMYRPDRVKVLVNLSVPFYPRNPEVNPVDSFRKLYGDDHYICRFQRPLCSHERWSVSSDRWSPAIAATFDFKSTEIHQSRCEKSFKINKQSIRLYVESIDFTSPWTFKSPSNSCLNTPS